MASNNQYQVLARKYRPRSFSELVGQEVLVSTLSNAIQMQRVHHAFLLTGTRGVGKTTSARIIAISLNCTGNGNTQPTITPCLECSNCAQIISGSHPDVIEFDAASKTGVDAIRDIIDSCTYPPMVARYKIYIIDEVHMLSKAAFNALLKTLEEPLNNIKFIFATTEIAKVPVTILSRCQKFNLRNLTITELTNHLINICDKEGIKYQSEALNLLASTASGSVRDSLSLLDQAIVRAKNGNNISYSDVQEMLTLPNKKEIIDLLSHCLSGNTEAAFSLLAELIKNNNDPLYIIETLLSITVSASKQIILKQEGGEMEEIVKKHSLPMLLRIYQITVKSLEEIKNLRNRELTIEVLIMKLLYASSLPTPIEIAEAINDKISASEDSQVLQPLN